MFQTFKHGFPHQPCAMAFDPVQRLLAIGTKSGSLRMYPLSLSQKPQSVKLTEMVLKTIIIIIIIVIVRKPSGMRTLM